jgi:hypothetical protein
VVECTALEMRHRCKPIGGSNPSLSATTLFSFVSDCSKLQVPAITMGTINIHDNSQECSNTMPNDGSPTIATRF